MDVNQVLNPGQLCLQMPIIHYNLSWEIHSQCHWTNKQSGLFKSIKSVLDEVEKDVTIEGEAKLE